MRAVELQWLSSDTGSMGAECYGPVVLQQTRGESGTESPAKRQYTAPILSQLTGTCEAPVREGVLQLKGHWGVGFFPSLNVYELSVLSSAGQETVPMVTGGRLR